MRKSSAKQNNTTRTIVARFIVMTMLLTVLVSALATSEDATLVELRQDALDDDLR